jgi:hypothetical protein
MPRKCKPSSAFFRACCYVVQLLMITCPLTAKHTPRLTAAKNNFHFLYTHSHHTTFSLRHYRPTGIRSADRPARSQSLYRLSPLVDSSGMILKKFGFVAFFAGVKASYFCIHLSCLVCIQSVVRGVWSRLFYGH